MTTKEYLQTIGYMNRKIESKAEEIRHLHDLATKITSGTEGDRVQENGSQDRLGDTVACIIDLEKEIQEMVQDAIKQRRIIANQIDEVDDEIHCNVLYKRYVLGKKFKDISVELNITMDHLFRVHRKAMRTFERKFGKEYIEKAK